MQIFAISKIVPFAHGITRAVKCNIIFYKLTFGFNVLKFEMKSNIFYLNSLVALKRAFLLLFESTNKQI